MRIGIYDPYLDSLSGGEKYMLSAAVCLAQTHDVSVFWNASQIRGEAQGKFGIDLANITITENIFTSDLSAFSKWKKTGEYDAIFYLSDGSIPLVNAKLFLHFQFPIEWINGTSIKNRLKMNRVSRVICNSLFTKQYIDQTFNIQSLVIYPPSGGEMPLMQKEKQNVILSVGRLSEIQPGVTFKKQEVMIAIFQKMIDEGLRDWSLTLVISFKDQDRKNMAFLYSLIGKYPITVIENASNTKLQELYAQAKIYWHAAGFGENVAKHPERVEHFGISTVQAMEHEAVPIVINLGGQKEIVDNGITGFLWDTKEECINQTLAIMQNEKLRQVLSREARKKATQFNFQTFCENLAVIIT